MKKFSLLLVEDDEKLGFVTKDGLEQNHFQIDWVREGQSALEQFHSKTYDAVILDVMLPGLDGFTIAEKIRQANQKIPIMFLSAKSLVEDKLHGLKLGGDDYLTKPFSMEELVIKLNNFIKRTSGKVTNSTSINLGKYSFNTLENALQIGDREIKLTKKEALVLQMFCENQGKVLKREQILKDIWGSDDYFLGRSLDVFISKLRKHLSEDPRLKITNYHGIGFKFEHENS